MNRLGILSMSCTLIQIMGLVLILFSKQLPDFIIIFIGIAGFAAIVKFCIPDATSQFDKNIRSFAACAGLGMIVIACVSV